VRSPWIKLHHLCQQVTMLSSKLHTLTCPMRHGSWISQMDRCGFTDLLAQPITSKPPALQGSEHSSATAKKAKVGVTCFCMWINTGLALKTDLLTTCAMSEFFMMRYLIGFLYSTAYMVEPEQCTSQSQKWHLIGNSQWFCGALMDIGPAAAASKHTSAPINHTRPSPS